MKVSGETVRRAALANIRAIIRPKGCLFRERAVHCRVSVTVPACFYDERHTKTGTGSNMFTIMLTRIPGPITPDFLMTGKV